MDITVTLDFDFSIAPYSKFKHWFQLSTSGYWCVWDIHEDGGQTYKGHFNEASSDEVKADFERFKSERPEYIAEIFHLLALDPDLVVDNKGDEVELLNSLKPIGIYDNLLAAAILMMDEHKDEAKSCKRITKLLKWLHATDFYFAPGSTIYHESYTHGLLEHHLAVAATITSLQNSRNFRGVTKYSEALFVALVHDWCKINKYQPSKKWTKDDNGQWVEVPSFKYMDSELPFGHGETSMFIAQKFYPLKTEVALAIRWHMGRWRVVDDDINDLQHANEVYPLVHLIQFADQLAITEYVDKIVRVK